MAESLCCSSKTATTLLISYTPKQNKKLLQNWHHYPKSLRTDWNPNYYTFTFYYVGALIPIKTCFHLYCDCGLVRWASWARSGCGQLVTSLPPSVSPTSLVTAWTAAGHRTRIFIKLSSVIHGCLPPELTRNSKPISTLGTGGLNCCFQAMLPCVGPPGISFVSPRSNYSTQLCPCKGPSRSWSARSPPFPLGASRGRPLSAKPLPVASWGSLGGGPTCRGLGWQSRKPAGERSVLGGLRG